MEPDDDGEGRRAPRQVSPGSEAPLISVRMILPAMWLAAVLAATACLPDAADQQRQYSTRDSAGVAIAENGAPEAPETAWLVADAPDVSIGRTSGDPRYEFDLISGIARFADGRIAVSDRSAEVRIFNIEGEYETTWGRKGDGPGEFRLISGLAVLHDTLAALDAVTGLALFSPAGEYVRTIPIPSPGGNWKVVGTLEANSVVLKLKRPVEMIEGSRRDSASYFRVFLNGSPPVPLGDFPEADVFSFRDSGRWAWGFVPYGRAAAAAAADSQFVFAAGDEYSMEIMDPTGSRTRIIRRTIPARPVDKAAISNDLSRRVRQAKGPEQVRRTNRIFSSEHIVYPKHMPALRQILVDDEGYIWVQEYDPNLSEDGTTWSVFAPSGRWLTDVATPAGFHAWVIAEDRAIGIKKNADGVEFIEMFSFRRR